ncbi:MAG: hypothetical protein ABIS29_15140 [Vicinamibacterales bacterium]
MNGQRASAAVGGTVALLLVTTITFGTALLALLGMWIAALIVRRQKQASTRFSSWLGAVYGVGMVIMIAGAAAMLNMTVANKDPAYQRTLDSVAVSSRSKPIPAWMERIAPGTGARARANPVDPGSKAFSVMGIGGAILGAVLFGTFAGVSIGTLTWAACLPLYFAITGRKLGALVPVDAAEH